MCPFGRAGAPNPCKGGPKENRMSRLIKIKPKEVYINYTIFFRRRQEICKNRAKKFLKIKKNLGQASPLRRKKTNQRPKASHEPPVKTGGLLLAISPCCQLAPQDAACSLSKLSVSPYFMPLKGLLPFKRIFVFLYTQLIYPYVVLLLILYVLPDRGFV